MPVGAGDDASAAPEPTPAAMADVEGHPPAGAAPDPLADPPTRDRAGPSPIAAASPKLQVDGDLGFVRLNDWSRTINVYLGLGDQTAAEDVVRNLAADSDQAADTLRRVLPYGQSPDTPSRRLNLDDYAVAGEDIDHLRAVFVPPPGFAEARATLTRQRLLVLTGAPHSGRLTTALALAAGFPDARPDAAPPICLLPHDLVVSERQLFQAGLLDQATFIVRDHGTQTASLAQSLLGQRRPPDVQRVRATLQQAHSRLILVCDPTSPLLTTAAVRDTLDAEGVLVEAGSPAAGRRALLPVLCHCRGERYRTLRALQQRCTGEQPLLPTLPRTPRHDAATAHPG